MSGSKTDFSYLRELEMKGVELALKRGDYVDEKWLVKALRANAGKPIPEAVLDYLCRFLEGAIDRPMGRKPVSKLERDRFNGIIAGHYRRYGEYLTGRKQRYGHHAGWTKSEYAPAEMAARLVARYYYYGEESWRTVQNIASSSKRPRIAVNDRD